MMLTTDLGQHAPPKHLPIPVKKALFSPDALVLVSLTTQDLVSERTESAKYTAHILALFNAIRKSTHGAWKGYAQNKCTAVGEEPDEPVTKSIQGWMDTTLSVFSVYTHGLVQTDDYDHIVQGVAVVAAFDGITFVPTRVAGIYAGNKGYKNIIQIDELFKFKNRTITFAFLDCCHSAGGSIDTTSLATLGRPASVADAMWATAFGIGLSGEVSLIDYGLVWGWNGDATTNALNDGDATHAPLLSDWLTWRLAFWDHMCKENGRIIDAGTHATRDTRAGTTHDPVEPWDNYKGWWYAALFGNSGTRIEGGWQ